MEDQQATLRNSVEQDRAQSAYKDAEAGMTAHKKEYSSFVSELPMLIKVNGLGAAIVFATYKNAASKTVYTQLERWLRREENQHLINLKEGRRLSTELTNCSSMEYKAVLLEIMAYVTWLRRFAKGLE